MASHAVDYPFHRAVKSYYDGECEVQEECWIPGPKSDFCPPDRSEFVADGIGKMLIEEVSRHKPGKYPERIFYVRKWQDPDGKVFGRPALRIATVEKFKRLLKGYKYEFYLEGEEYA